MFIVHGAWLRKYMRWILGGLLIVLIPGFIALFTTTGGRRGENRVPTVRGKPVNPGEFQAARNSVLVQYIFNTGEQVPRGRETEQALTREAVIQMLVLREARTMGLRVSDEEVRQQTERQPLFRNEQGQFDYYRYTALLGRFKLTPRDYEETVREQLLLARLRELVCSGAKVTPAELQREFTVWNEQVTLDYVALAAADARAEITIADADARAFYDQNPEAYRIPKRVKVRYAFVPVETNAVAVSDQDIAAYFERNRAQYTNTLEEATAEIRAALIESRARRRTGDRATELSIKLVAEPGQPRPDFAQVAAAYGATVAETEFFGPQDPPPGIAAGPEFNQAAFSLNDEIPFSDPVEAEGGYYVLGLGATQPSEIPPFEAVQAQVVEQLKGRRAHEATLTRGGELRQQVVALLAAGKSFADACAELKLTVQKSAPFTIGGATPDLPAATAVKEKCLSLRVGEVSEFIPTADGGLFFHVADRQPPVAGEEATTSLEQLRQRLLQAQQEILWQSWLGSLWRANQVDLGFPAQPVAEPLPEDS